jgi:hypothetical protein
VGSFAYHGNSCFSNFMLQLEVLLIAFCVPNYQIYLNDCGLPYGFVFKLDCWRPAVYDLQLVQRNVLYFIDKRCLTWIHVNIWLSAALPFNCLLVVYFLIIFMANELPFEKSHSKILKCEFVFYISCIIGSFGSQKKLGKRKEVGWWKLMHGTIVQMLFHPS